MGGACVCHRKISESCLFWSRLNIRKITFQEYIKILEDKRTSWLKSANKNNQYSIEISECEVLRDLLNSPDFSDKERNFFFEKLKKFIAQQTDKLLFLTCLAFFTKLEPSKEDSADLNANNKTKNKNFSLEEEAKNYIESLKMNSIKENFDIIFDQLLKMAIKKEEHNEVTKIFIELVSEFSVDLLKLNLRIKKDLSLQFSQETRDKLFSKLLEMPKKKFYEYIFNENNVKLINDDLAKIYETSVFVGKNKMISCSEDLSNERNLIMLDASKTTNKIKNKGVNKDSIGRI